MNSLQRLAEAAEKSILQINEIEALLGDKQYISPSVIDAVIDYYDSQITMAEGMGDCENCIKSMEDRVLELQIIQKQIRQNGELTNETTYLVDK